MFGKKKNDQTELNSAENFENSVSGVETAAKKGSGKKIAIGAGAAAVVLVGGGVAAFNLSPLVENQVRKHIMSDAKYYAWVNEENAETIAKEIREEYEKSLDTYDKGAKGNIALSYAPSDEAKAYLTDDLDDGTDESNQLIDLINNIGSVEIGTGYNSKKSVSQYSVYAKLNDDQLVTFDVLTDLEGMGLYARIPELTETWLAIPLEDAVSEADSYELEEFMQYKDMLVDILENPKDYLSPEDLEKEITRYVNVWNETIADHVEVESGVSVDVLDIEQKYSVSSVKVNAKLELKLAKNMLKEIKNDKVVKNIACDKLEVIDEDEFKDSIDELIDMLDDSKDDVEDELPEFKLKTYIDAKGVIRGIEVKGDGYSGKLIVGKDGDKVRGEAYVETDDEELFRAELTADGDKKYTGELDVIVDDESVFSLEFSDYEVVNEEKGFFNGTFTAIIPDIDPITLTFKATSDSQAISYDINLGGTDYGVVTLTVSQKDGADVKVPDDTFEIDPDGDIDLKEYVSQDEVEKFVKDILTKLGFDDDTASDAAKEAAEDIYAEAEDFGKSSSYGYYDDYDDLDYDWNF